MTHTRKEKERFADAGKRAVDFVNAAETIDRSEIDASWRKFQYKLRKLVLPKYRRIIISTASAAAIIAVGMFILFKPAAEIPVSFASTMLNNTVNYNAGEIVLTTDNRAQELANESEICYDGEGTLQVNMEVVERGNEAGKKSEPNRLIVPRGRRTSVTFSDGTRMYVNAGSQVIYPRVFSREKREIIVYGEVYLEVTKDSERPFIVKTGNFDIKVLGTSFNVRTYEDEPASVVLIEGNVEVKNSDKTFGVKPGQMLSMDNGRVSVSQVDVNEYIAWIDNIMYLSGHDLGDILDRLGNYYNIDISYDKTIGRIPAGGKLNLRNGLREVMDILCLSFGLRAEIDDAGDVTLCKQPE